MVIFCIILFCILLKILLIYNYKRLRPRSTRNGASDILYMNEIILHKQWKIKSPINDVFKIMTDFKNFPKYFPKVAETIEIKEQNGNNLEIEAVAKSFGRKFKVNMKTQILPNKGFISDNNSYQFGTSGHEELLLSESIDGTIIDYTYKVTIHKKWLAFIATPLIKWYSIRYWEKAVIDELRNLLVVDK